jgi:hypothetical protein
MLSISLFVKEISSIESVGQTGRHIPHPLQVLLFIEATSFPSASIFEIALKGHASLQALHQLQLDLST